MDAQPRALEQLQEVGVGVLGDDHEVRAQRHELLHVRLHEAVARSSGPARRRSTSPPRRPSGSRRRAAAAAGSRPAPRPPTRLIEATRCGFGAWAQAGPTPRSAATASAAARPRRTITRSSGRGQVLNLDLATSRSRRDVRARDASRPPASDAQPQAAAHGATERGVAERLLVLLVKQVLGDHERLERADDAHAQPRVEARVAAFDVRPIAGEVAVRALADDDERRARAPAREGQLGAERALVLRAGAAAPRPPRRSGRSRSGSRGSRRRGRCTAP